MKKLITLIICCYNNEKFLSKCLNSIIKQKKNKIPFDIIFVNDGSQDSSLSIANKILNKIENVKIINNKKNLGLSKSCNKAIKSTQTEYFIRIDSDDYVSSRFVYYFEKAILKNKTDFIFCNRIEFWNKKKKFVSNSKLNLFKMISCATCLNTKKVKKIGGYKNILWEEYDLYIRYLRKKKNLINIDKYLYFYRKHYKSMSFSKKWSQRAWFQLEKKFTKNLLMKFGNYNKD